MSIVINGSGTITGITAGGLPDATITQAELATGVAGTGPAFSAYASSTTSYTTATYTKVLFATEEFDTANCFSSSRFTPTVAGYYLINAQVYAPAVTRVIAAIYKNGSLYKFGNDFTTAAGEQRSIVNSLVYCNGSTDYVEIYGLPFGGSNFGSGIENCYFNGSLVRAA